jgi:TonB family protein
MVTGNAVRSRRAGGYSLLASLCMHVAAFAFLGIIVLNDLPEPREFVNVEFVTATQQVRRFRRNMLKPRSQMVRDAAPSRKAQDAIRPLIDQVAVSSHAPAETVSVLQYEPAELSEVYPRKPSVGTQMSVRKMTAPVPMARSPRKDVLGMHDHLLELFPLHSPMAPPVRKVSDSKILQDFLKIISRKIEESKRYPRWAMDAGLEGMVVIRFSILQDGTLDAEIQLVSSSGTQVLDNAAVAAVRDAAPFPALPRALKRERLQIELPMHFRLTG